MPQLNLHPWFIILLFSWMIFLMILPKKVMKYLFNNNPSFKTAEKSKPEPWNWPWT
uniref:ATP synthase complex subunit 8 n=1 Tax=Chlamydoselachus anguineus TaxID=27585 RepID=U6C0S3_CHLAN|nr:ATP synthase F0 subunit 8 [Chlamydoselachus anguineus]ANN44609.1 ATP synthase F0 subunit 8 [Chlamydoselachus anguineus]BAO02704.1 ATP synthase F0 subunit 8 [Chlamydoselachus anguineus]